MKNLDKTVRLYFILSLVAVVLYALMIFLGYTIESFGALNGIRAVVLPLSFVLFILAHMKDKKQLSLKDLKYIGLIKRINAAIFVLTILTIVLMAILFSPLLT